MTTPASPEDEIVVLLPAPQTAAISAEERCRIDSGLAVLLERHHRTDLRRNRRARFAGPAVVSASVAAVAVLCALAVGGGPTAPVDRTRPVVATPQAVAVLQQASNAVVADRAPVVGENQFVYTRSTVISNEGVLGELPSVGAPHEREIWISQDPGPVTQVGVIREFGQDWPLSGGGPVPEGVVRPTYAWLDSLPADPDDLLAEIESDVATVDADLDRDHVVFSRIGDLVREGLVPPRVAAALFEAATRIPGVRVESDASDALGRRGIGISHEDRLVRSVWIFDPQTFEVIGTRDYAVLDGPDLLIGASAVLERAVTDTAGLAPPRPTA